MDEVKQEIVLECTEFETSSLQPFAKNDESMAKNNLCTSKSWSIANQTQQNHKSCGLTNTTYPLRLVQEGTIIIYFSSEDGFLSEEIMLLDKKFCFYHEFFCTTRKYVGDIIIFNKNPNYLLCGCIIKKSKNDEFDFSALQECLTKITSENKKYKFPYIAFQAFEDNSYFNKKISNMIQNSVSAVEVYICWWNQETDVQQYENDNWNKMYSDNYWHKWTFPVCPGTSQSDWFDKNNSPDMSNSELTTFHLAENSHWNNIYDNEMHLNIEYELFNVQNYDTMIFSKVKEINIPFDLLKNYSPAYFVTEDMNVDIEFQKNNNFGNILGQLLNQKQKAGTAAIVKHTSHSFTYCAITRQLESEILSSKTIFLSLQQIREHATEHNVKKIIFPNIRLSHDEFVEKKIKYMLEFIFRNTDDAEIVLSSVEKNERVRESKSPILKHMKSSLFQQTKEKSTIIYFCDENGRKIEEMKIWNKLFNFHGPNTKWHKLIIDNIISYTSYTREYTRNTRRRRLHMPNYTHSKNQIYGCIVYKDDGIDFAALQKCISKINSINKMKKIRNVYVQAVHDSEKSIDNFKIINILMSTLEEVIINVCWPDDLCISEPFIKLTVT